MAHQVRAVVVREQGAPASVETVLVPDPGPGEVLVRVSSCGVCRTDLDHREVGGDAPFPVLLGHEAAGVVEAVGAGVTRVAPDDFVALNWRTACGSCRSCRRGRLWGCRAVRRADRPMTLPDGTPLSPVLGVGGFAEKTLVAEAQCVRIDPVVSPVVAGLLGCGVMAGFGAAVHTGGVGRGDSIAVIGCDGVGLAAVAGARVAGARRIVAVDADGRRLDLAERFGATGTVDSSRIDAVDGIRSLTGGLGADVVVDAVGTARTYRQACYARDLNGVVVLAAAPAPEATVELPLGDVFGRGGSLRASWHGDFLPSRDVPALLDLYLQGRFDLRAFLGEKIALDDVETALGRMRFGGDVLRPVVLM
ncbi:zinc-binding dehydrogenase [Streptomyces cavernicola]|uniref:Zinc-binding dehydrogenase n=1 Tax=Streptomyces cavernicola TaxID=3043613 RepID=A0ABT6SNI0_9ACTN|nr:zinc-binding dehydrogenase [Streptomyces sp. B-S-A6]MDI3409489.1 zinc-binding dehydrogenase [Streptomyces sp. B-S-A6]